MELADICVNYYGKPYQTAVTLLTLWKHSSSHINKIYVVVEKVQPYNEYQGVPLLKYMLRDLPVEYVFPKYFYYSGSPPEDWLADPEKRYGLKYQYALEESKMKFLFLTHNDCLYKDDLLGAMLGKVDNFTAGIGLVGQCWNCPAFSARKCDSSNFENYVPDAAELKDLVDTYHPPRASIHYALIEKGIIHPLPECRLNEYACLINVPLYQQNVVPKGDLLPFGGSWHGTDWGAIWFNSMVNRNYKFINFPFEPLMSHAPFSSNGSGHVADSDISLYHRTERSAREFLIGENYIQQQIPVSVKIRQIQSRLKNLLRTLKSKLKG